MIIMIKPLVIDTLDLTVGLSKAAFLFLCKSLWIWKKSKPPGSSDHYVVISKKKLITRLVCYVKPKRVLGAIEVGMTKSQHRYARVSLQVGASSHHEIQKFWNLLSTEIPFLNYDKLFHTANVSRVDFAIDIIGFDYLQSVPYRPKTAWSNFYTREDGTRGTLYLGSILSNVRVRIYDKKRQMEGLGIFLSSALMSRVEVQLRRLKMPLSEIEANLVNPFGSLVLARLDQARALAQLPWWQDFLNEAEQKGAQRALKSLPKHRCHRATALLRKVVFSWWKPDALWAGLPKALSKIRLHPT